MNTIPCRLCGDPTNSLGTKLCDGCWEVDARIERMVEDCKDAAWLKDVREAINRRLYRMGES